MGPGNHVLDGVPDPPMGRGKFLGENGRPIVKYTDTTVVCGKTAEPIGMPFGLWARMACRNRVGRGPIDAEGRCHGNQFWEFAITGFGV